MQKHLDRLEFSLFHVSQDASIDFSSESGSYSSISSHSLGADNRDIATFLSDLPPVTHSCWLENIFAELTVFTQKILKNSGIFCPHPSPSKKSNVPNKQITATAQTQLNQALFFAEPNHPWIVRASISIETIDADAGRHYAHFIQKAKLFQDRLDLLSLGNCELFLNHHGVIESKRIAKNLKNFTPVSLIVFLCLVDKYPQAPQDKISLSLDTTFISAHFDSDIYLAFRSIDRRLKDTYLTKEASKIKDMLDAEDGNDVHSFGL